MTSDNSHLSQLGGMDALHVIIEDFINRVYQDPIIGFFFLKVDKEMLIGHELTFAARHLGGDVQYTGRPLQHAHKQHPINSGQFHRRIWLLEQTLLSHEVPESIRHEWLEHNRKLEPLITDGTDCFPPTPSTNPSTQ